MKKIVNTFLLTTGIVLFSFYTAGCSNNIDSDEYTEDISIESEQNLENLSARSMTTTALIGTDSTAHVDSKQSGKKDSSKGDKGHHHFGRSDKSKHNK